MKPFNIEEARAGKKVVTRNGNDVTLYGFDLRNEAKVVGVVHLPKQDLIKGWDENGREIFSKEHGVENPFDLFMESISVASWVILNSTGGLWSAKTFSTKEDADEYINVSAHRHNVIGLKVIPIKYEM